eukprot:TRINITY_DN81846_c0_g1_i1.p1 TRINITY_DN81846_c0_g1~~TRINITY_DN81846_c0_g1_i1.p1  ORF type:complete len:540 (-),score=55.73 TRINITY_DN81846_c0_g1_i1:44-1663(-)
MSFPLDAEIIDSVSFCGDSDSASVASNRPTRRSALTVEEWDACRRAFQCRSDGIFSLETLDSMLESLHIPAGDRSTEWRLELQSKYFPLGQGEREEPLTEEEFLTIAQREKECFLQRCQDVQRDLVDAFVAMGGEPDGGGEVDARRVKQACLSFQLTIDVDRVLHELDRDGNNTLDFGEFAHLLYDEAAAVRREAQELRQEVRRQTLGDTLTQEELEGLLLHRRNSSRLSPTAPKPPLPKFESIVRTAFPTLGDRRMSQAANMGNLWRNAAKISKVREPTWGDQSHERFKAIETRHTAAIGALRKASRRKTERPFVAPAPPPARRRVLALVPSTSVQSLASTARSRKSEPALRRHAERESESDGLSPSSSARSAELLPTPPAPVPPSSALDAVQLQPRISTGPSSRPVPRPKHGPLMNLLSVLRDMDECSLFSATSTCSRGSDGPTCDCPTCLKYHRSVQGRQPKRPPDTNSQFTPLTALALPLPRQRPPPPPAPAIAAFEPYVPHPPRAVVSAQRPWPLRQRTHPVVPENEPIVFCLP